METNHNQSVSVRAFVDTKDPMDASHQLGTQQSYRDYQKREDHDTSSRRPVARSTDRNLAVIEDSRGKKIPLKTPAEIREIPKVVPKTRGEIKKRRRQELQDDYDTAPHGPAVDELPDQGESQSARVSE